MKLLNGEFVAGVAFAFLAFIFMLGGTVNAVLGTLYIVYYIFLATGIALMFLGYRTARSETKSTSLNVAHIEPTVE